MRCWSKVGRAQSEGFRCAYPALLLNFAVLHDKPWLSPLGLAAAYEEVAASLRGKGHSQATGLSCFEKVHQLRLAWQTGNYDVIDADSGSDAAAQNEKCRQLLAQLQAEQPAAGVLSVAEVRPHEQIIPTYSYFILLSCFLFLQDDEPASPTSSASSSSSEESVPLTGIAARLRSIARVEAPVNKRSQPRPAAPNKPAPAVAPPKPAPVAPPPAPKLPAPVRNAIFSHSALPGGFHCVC